MLVVSEWEHNLRYCDKQGCMGVCYFKMFFYLLCQFLGDKHFNCVNSKKLETSILLPIIIHYVYLWFLCEKYCQSFIHMGASGIHLYQQPMFSTD